MRKVVLRRVVEVAIALAIVALLLLFWMPALTD